jgi:hypothetical protein
MSTNYEALEYSTEEHKTNSQLLKDEHYSILQIIL